MVGTLRTWIDGAVQTVPADDERIAEEERRRVLLMHVANMRRLDLHGRRDYLANVERREGAEASESLRVAFHSDWMANRGAP